MLLNLVMRRSFDRHTPIHSKAALLDLRLEPSGNREPGKPERARGQSWISSLESMMSAYAKIVMAEFRE